jgi:hypothetical protein
MGLRSPVSCANPTTSEAAIVFDSVSVHADREVLEVQDTKD